MENEIKPCPFCGGVSNSDHSITHQARCYILQLNDILKSLNYRYEPSASRERAWNRRYDYNIKAAEVRGAEKERKRAEEG